MQFPKDNPPICACCEIKPAVKEYAFKNFSEMVCADCFDRRSVQDLLENKIAHIVALTRGKKYDEAIAFLDAILEENRYRDHDGWLARCVAHERALILFGAGRY